jgi:hypothetical protein
VRAGFVGVVQVGDLRLDGGVVAAELIGVPSSKVQGLSDITQVVT